MKLAYLALLCFLPLNARAATPSKLAIYSCLAAQSVSPTVEWRGVSTREINSEDDYKDGYDASYYIVDEGREIGYAEKGSVKAILYDREIYPIDLAQALPGFDAHPTELNPFSAEWGMVLDSRSRYLCVSFPFGALGKSGSFQSNRSAYLIPLNAEHGRRVLFSATGNIASFLPNAAPPPSVNLLAVNSHADCAEAALPKDVRAFVKKREGCEHFRGEIPDPSEKARMIEVSRKIHAFCKGTDRALAGLKKKYTNNSVVLARLSEYEDEIEAHPERQQGD